MIQIKKITNEGFKITWTLIFLGFKGSFTFYDTFDVEDILEYSRETLKENDYDKIVLELASEYKENTEEIHFLLSKLSESENSNENIELRKLRFIKIIDNIKIKNVNSLQSIIELINIFSEVEIQEKLFHKIEEPAFILNYKNNIVKAKEYYNKKNYDFLFQSFKIWLEKEKEYILNHQ